MHANDHQAWLASHHACLKGANNVKVQGGTYVAAATGSSVTIHQGSHAGSSGAFQHLSAAAAPTALHDAAARFDAPRCYRNTRATYLDKLELWLLGTSEEFAGIHLIWLHGSAGIGKSAIMQSVVDRCTQHTVILGTFFFSRSDSLRNYAEVLIPTLAYQLARDFPEAISIIENVINRDPLIFKASLHTQAFGLLVRPILHLIDTGVIEHTDGLRRVFIIDGLDECTDPQKQILLINVITSILCEFHVPVRFLVASRPEIAISCAFEQAIPLHGMFATLPLEDNAEARSDIRQYVADSFCDIVDSHPMRKYIPLPWPHIRSIYNIVEKSSGHFIYAATAMKFVASSDEHPVRALQVIEGLEISRTRSPFAELDALYHHILASAKYAQNALTILRQCFFLPDLGTTSISSTDEDLPLSQSVPLVSLLHEMSLADIDLFLSDVQALVSVYFDGRSKISYIHPKHQSLGDFMKDEARSQGLYMAPGVYRASLLPRFFRLLDLNGTGFNFTCSISYRSPIWRNGVFRNDIATGGSNPFISTMCEAFEHCQDSELLDKLVRGCSIEDIWCFHQRSPSAGRYEKPNSTVTVRSFSVAKYMSAIRDCISNQDNALYLQQFPIYLKFLLESLSNNSGDAFKLPQLPTQMGVLSDTDASNRPSAAKNCLIQALLFSSSPSSLRSTHHLIFKFHAEFGINQWQACYLVHLIDCPHPSGTDHRTMEALRRMPQSKLSWSADLAMAMELILRLLLCQSWKAPFYFMNQHEQWLKRTKPLKHSSTGFPELASRFYDYGHGRGWARPIANYDYDLPYSCSFPPACGPFLPESCNRETNGWYVEPTPEFPFYREPPPQYPCDKAARIMCDEGYDCILLLKAVIFFLRKADHTREVIQLARRSLPKVTLWFPKLMKRARREMDEYVRQWEESTDGFLEKAD